MKKIKNFMISLDEDITINRKLLFFEILSALLGGIVIGFLLTPFRSVTIASNNENNGNGNGNSSDPEGEKELEIITNKKIGNKESRRNNRNK
ncbi:MAG: hypothetical protein IJ711_11985 [Lachnospiraceae bacterium]|nr:hypothetical protein [Lachnospiraceae bacterium]